MSSSRSSFIPFKHNAATESFKRSSHNDFATSYELKQRKFTGVRDNSITGKLEFWILGNLRKEITPEQTVLNPNWLQDTFAELYGTK